MRLKRIVVRGLFGRFDHNIRMNLDDRITILTGPNGSGKTMILRMVHALFAQSIWGLSRFPYRELRAEFDSGTQISVRRQIQGAASPGASSVKELDLECEHPGQKAKRDSLKGPTFSRADLPFPTGAIEDMIPELDQISPELWRQRGSGETLSLEEVLDRYWEDLPLEGHKIESNAPDWLKEIRRQIPTRFIETDRLYTRGSRARQLGPRWQSRTRYAGDSLAALAVNRYSQELGETIRETLTKYGETSQSLDRTFPARVVSEQQPSVSLAELRTELSELETKRAALVSAGLLAQESDYWPVAISQQIDETKLGVLSVYVRDTKDKLAVFDEILAKVELFKEIINARFLDKRLVVSQSGFAVQGEHGSPLPLNLLSSGEQHELVLFYGLLFNVTRNSLILIDEPEISLHVAWQEAFLEDLARVAGISKFDAVVATHSPQIINTHWDLTVELQALSGKIRAKAESGSNREHRTA